MNQEAILQVRNISIQFGGNQVIQDVDLDVAEASVKSLVGPNGAGKTTLFNIISGQYRPSSGRVICKGRDITGLGAAEKARIGIGRSFQLTNIFPTLSVLENVRLAVQARSGVGLEFWRHYKSYSGLVETAREILAEVMLAEKADLPAVDLTHAEQRKLELAILLGLDSDILLLDEPTAGMSLEEVPTIVDVIRRIKQSGKRTILLVEHKFDMILSISDTIAVLQDGRLICDDVPEVVSNNEMVLEAYLGGGMKDE